MSRSIDLSGRTALVSGAGSGIGRGCALGLAAAGANVVVADINRAAAKAVADDINTIGSGTAVALDVSSWDQCTAVAHDHPDVSILVNAAATWSLEQFVDADPATWDRHLGVTLVGTLNLTRALLPAMIAADAGSIVNISSDAGRIGQPQQVLYSAAKAGIIGATRSLALEVGRHGVRVNCVAPGLTRTPASEPFIESFGLDRLVRQYPLGRIGEPDDVSDAVLFFASDMSRWVTGQVLSVNGGFTTGG